MGNLVFHITHTSVFSISPSQIFSTYSGENIGNCRGHNGKVRSVYWTPDDSGLVSSGMDGAVYEWELKEGMGNADVAEETSHLLGNPFE